ncbi:MAG: hypothetical protein AB1480_11450 [Nitrospirota bacterium]
MKRKLLAVTLCLVLTVSVGACKKKEAQPPIPQTPGTAAPGQMPQGPMMQGPLSPGGQQQVPGPGMMMPKGQSQINIPDSVRGKWSAAKIILEDRIAKTKQEYTVKLNSDFSIPNSNLKITVGEFLPDFKMEGFTLTSVSNQPNNPALAIRVFEGGKQIFPAPGRKWGWLFAKVPTIHPFEHPKYGIVLKEGIRRG